MRLSLMRMLGGLLLVISQNMAAVEIEGLYQGEAVVADQSTEARNAAVGTALKSVLGRLVPRRELSTPAARKLLSSASNYVSYYRYGVEDRGPETVPVKKLVVEFDHAMLMQALRAGGLSVWEGPRPEVLVWLWVEDEAQATWLSAEVMPEIHGALAQAAHRRGVPLLYPLLDLTDRGAVSAQDVGRPGGESIRRASGRYQAEYVLAGRLVHSADDLWTGNWQLFAGDSEAAWSGPEGSLPEVLDRGLGGVYDRLVNLYAVAMEAGKPSVVQLDVDGVRGAAELAKVTRYLEGLAMVESVHWVRLDENGAAFRLMVKGNASALARILAVGRVLEPLESAREGVLNSRVVPAYVPGFEDSDR